MLEKTEFTVLFTGYFLLFYNGQDGERRHKTGKLKDLKSAHVIKPVNNDVRLANNDAVLVVVKLRAPVVMGQATVLTVQ